MNDRIRMDHENRCYYISDLPPIGVCLYTDSEYFLVVNPMIRGVDFITDDEAVFCQETQNHWAGDKGLFMCISCWEVCRHLIINSTGFPASDMVEIEYHHKPRACHYAILKIIEEMRSFLDDSHAVVPQNTMIPFEC